MKRGIRNTLDAIEWVLDRVRTRLLGEPWRHRRIALHAPDQYSGLDIFAGEWMSEFPLFQHQAHPGVWKTFSGERLAWALEQLGDLRDKTVLELGPYEGGHTYFLLEQGASHVTAIEGNPRAFLKCLLVKEAFELTRAKFLFGDFDKYLDRTVVSHEQSFDLCVASGVLYHQENPVSFLEKLCAVAPNLILWTHFCQNERDLNSDIEHRGVRYRVQRFTHGIDLSRRVFCGGPYLTKKYLRKDDLFSVLKTFGFEIVAQREEPTPYGPALQLTARQK